MKSDLKRLEMRSSLPNSCVSSGTTFWNDVERLTNWGPKEGVQKAMQQLPRHVVLRLPGTVYARCLEKRCRQVIEPQLEEIQCGFHPGRSTTHQIFTLQQIFKKSWEYFKGVYVCFVDLEKTYNRVP